MNDLNNKNNIENQEENLEKKIEKPQIVNNLNDNKEKKTLNDNSIFEFEQIISQKNKKTNIMSKVKMILPQKKNLKYVAIEFNWLEKNHTIGVFKNELRGEVKMITNKPITFTTKLIFFDKEGQQFPIQERRIIVYLLIFLFSRELIEIHMILYMIKIVKV